MRDPGVQWTFRLRGLEAGQTTLVLRGVHDQHSHVSTLPIPVTVDSAPSGGLTVSGRVTLKTVLTTLSGDSLGFELYPDQTGIRVYVERPDGSIDSTSTEAGAFRFTDLGDDDKITCAGTMDAYVRGFIEE